MRQKFYNSFSFIIILILSILIIAISYISSYQNTSLVKEFSISLDSKNTEKYLNIIHDNLIEKLSNQYNSANSIKNFIISKNDIIKDVLNQRLNEQLEYLLNENVNYFNLHDLYFIDSSGKILLSSNKFSKINNINEILQNYKYKISTENIFSVSNFLFFKDLKENSYYNLFFFPFNFENRKYILILRYELENLLSSLNLYSDRQEIVYIYNKNVDEYILSTQNNQSNISIDEIKNFNNQIVKNSANNGEKITLHINKTIYNGTIKKINFTNTDLLIVDLKIIKDEVFNLFVNKFLFNNFAGLFVIFIVSFGIIFFILKFIGCIGKNLQLLAEGDLKSIEPMRIKWKNEIGLISQNFNESFNKLKSILIESAELINRLSENASDISTTSIELSNRTESAASSLEETSAMLEEATSSIKKSLELLNNIDKNSKIVQQLTKSGKEIIENTLRSISNIVSMTKRINEINEFITEMTFQTNLLSLNAAVEAARAGEAGRGFAIVAAEIRNLSQKSAKSAKEITEIISNVIKEINLTDTNSKEIEKNFTALFENINHSIDSISLVSNSFNEQFNTIEQITNTIINLNEITQDNASFAEEFASTSENMYASFENLKQLISFFKMDNINLGESRTQKSSKLEKKNKIFSKSSKIAKPFNKAINIQKKVESQIESSENKNNEYEEEEFSNYEEF